MLPLPTIPPLPHCNGGWTLGLTVVCKKIQKSKLKNTHPSYQLLPLPGVPPLPPCYGGHLMGGRRRAGSTWVQQIKKHNKTNTTVNTPSKTHPCWSWRTYVPLLTGRRRTGGKEWARLKLKTQHTNNASNPPGRRGAGVEWASRHCFRRLMITELLVGLCVTANNKHI